MEKEDKIIIDIETMSAESSVRDLKDHIKTLRDALVRCKEGSDEYKEALNLLIQKELKLASVMKAGKNEIVAAEGSYNALATQMAALKKVWKETTDVAERDRIGKQINTLNERLKALDATIGNSQRKVGSYEDAIKKALVSPQQHIRQLRNELGQLTKGTVEYEAKLRELADATTEQRKLNEQLKWSSSDLGDMLSNVGGIATSLVGAFSAFDAAMGLMGADDSNFAKATQRAARLIQLVQGLEKLEQLSDKLKGFFSAFKIGSEAMAATKAGTAAVGTASLASAAQVGTLAASEGKTTKETVKLGEALQEAGMDARAFNASTNESTASLGKLEAALAETRKQLKDYTSKGSMSDATAEEVNELEMRKLALEKLRRVLAIGVLDQTKAEQYLNMVLSASGQQLHRYSRVFSALIFTKKADTTATKEEIIQEEKLAATQVKTAATTKGLAGSFKSLFTTIGNFLKGNAIMLLLSAIVVEIGLISKHLKDVKDLKNQIKLKDDIKNLEELGDAINKTTGLLKARGATDMEVTNAEIEGTQKLLEAQRDYVVEIEALYGKKSDKLKEELDKLKESEKSFTENLNNAYFSLEGLLSEVEKNEAQKGMSDLEKTVEDLNIQFAQAKILAGNLFDEGIISAGEYQRILQRIREDLPLAIEQAKAKTGGSGKSVWQKEEDEIKKLLKTIEEENKTEIQKLKEKYEKEKKLLKKHHKDTTLLTQQYLKKLKELQDKADLDRYKASEELYKKLYNTKSPYDKLKLDVADAEERLEVFNDAIAKGWNVDPSKNVSITKDMMDALEALKRFGVTSEEEFAVGYAETQKIYKDAVNALKEFERLRDDKKEELALQNRRDSLKSATKEWYQADADLKKAMLDNVVKGMNETEEEFQARLIKAKKEFAAAMAMVANFDTSEKQKRLDSNADTAASKYGSQSMQMYKARLEAAIFYRDNLLQLEDETDAEYFARQQEANAAVVDANKDMVKQLLQNHLDLATGIGNILGTMADYYEEDIRQREKNGKISEEQAKNEFENVKKLQISQSIINTIAGAISAFTSAQDLGEPWGMMIGAVNAAAVMAAGIAEIQKIKHTEYGSSSIEGSSITSASQPVAPSFTPGYTQNITGQNEIDRLRNAMSEANLWVNVTDINKAQEKGRARVAETTF